MKCACGCGGEIIIKPHHSWSGIPKYIQGHNSKDNPPMIGKTHKNESKGKISKTKQGAIPWNKGTIGLQIAWNKGKKEIYSEETLKKMSDAKQGYIPWNMGKTGVQIAWNKGIPCSEETKQKLSDACKGRFEQEDSPHWNPNLTDEERQIRRNYPEYAEWRTEVYKRDNYICQICFKRGGNINAHHIESYRNNPDLRTELSNGITMCEEHHKDFHHQYGRGNNTKQQLIEFIKNKEENYNDKAA